MKQWMLVLVMVLVAALGGVSCGRAVGVDPDAGVTLATGPPQWAMFGATPQRTGRSANVGPSQGGRYEVIELASEEDAAHYVVVQSVGPRGAVYVTIRSRESVGRLLSLEPDGTRTWMFPPESEPQNLINGGVALDDSGHLFFEGWRIDYDVQPVSPPVYQFFDLDMSGVLAWAWPPAEPPVIVNDRRHSTPLYDEAGNVYVLFRSIGETGWSSSEQYLHSFAPDGQLRWRWDQDVGERLAAPPTIGPDGTLYVVVRKCGLSYNPENGLYALDTDGNVRWSVLLFDHYVTTLAVGDDGTIYLAGSIDDEQLTIRAIAPDGSTDWSLLPVDQHAHFSQTTSLAIAPDGTIYLGSSFHLYNHEPTEPPGMLVAASPAGVLKWSIDTALSPYGGIAVDASNAVYTVTRGISPPTLLGFESDGTQRLSVVLDDTGDSPWFNLDDFFPSAVVIGEGGRLYVGSTSGRLHIVHP